MTAINLATMIVPPLSIIGGVLASAIAIRILRPRRCVCCEIHQCTDESHRR